MRKKKLPPPPSDTQPIPPPAEFDATGIKLTDAQYWKWRLTIEEMQHAATRRDLKQSECRIRELELEIGKLQLIAMRAKYQEQVVAVDAAKKEYDTVKAWIESQIGRSLNGCVIDELTWEVKELPET